MARVTVKRGLDGVSVEAVNVGSLRENAMVQALGIPDVCEWMIDGIAVTSTCILEDGDVVIMQQKAAEKA